MSRTLKNVVIVGASGNLGPSVVPELLSAGVHITATTRRESKSKFPEGVKVVPTDYSVDHLTDIFKGHDAVLALVGGDQLELQTVLIDAAVKAGVRRFFLSEFGLDTSDDADNAGNPIAERKRAIQQYAASKEAQGLEWTAIINGAFFDWGVNPHVNFLKVDLKTKKAEITDGGNEKFSATNLATVGKAVAALATKPELLEASKNQYVRIASHTISQNDYLKLAEEVTGSKFDVTHKNSKEYIPEAQEQVKAGNHFAAYTILQGWLFGAGHVADGSKIGDGLWNDRLGLPKEDLRADVERFAKLYA